MEIKHKAFDTGKIVLGRNSVRNRCICLAVLFFFVLNTFLPPVYAFELPSLFDSLQTPFEPILLKGVSFDYNDPFHFEFIVDQGREKSKNEQVLKNEIRPLIEYFLLGLTVPEEDLWVNLSYYEQDRILPDQLNGTAIGKTFVTQDLLLKKIASSLTFPEGKEGKVFWEELYSRMRAIYKTTNIPVDILNKVWIVPDQAVVVTYKNKAFVAKASLKVMLDEDFEAVNRHVAATADNKVPGETKRDVNKISTDLMREKILPLIEKKINTSKEFAALRQVYYSLILATYYKNLLKDSIFYLYVNKNKTKTLQLSDPKLKDKIYEEYLQQYKDGIYQHVRKEYDEQRHAMVSKRYVSGGVQMSVSSAIVTVPSSSAVLSAVRESFDAPVEAKVDIQQRVGEGDLNRQTTSGVAAAASSGVEAGVKEAIKSSMLDNIKEAVNKAWPVILLGVMVSIPPTIFSISTSDVFVNRSAA